MIRTMRGQRVALVVLSIAAETGAGCLVAAITGDARSLAGRIAFLRGERLFFMNGDGSAQRYSGWRADATEPA
jgi:hypothetical protein